MLPILLKILTLLDVVLSVGQKVRAILKERAEKHQKRKGG